MNVMPQGYSLQNLKKSCADREVNPRHQTDRTLKWRRTQKSCWQQNLN